ARFRAHENITALNFVAEGLGMTITSDAQLRSFPDQSALFLLPHFKASLPQYLGYLRTRAEEPAIRAMRDAAQQVWHGPKLFPAPPTGTPASKPTSRGRRQIRTRRVNS